MRADTLLAAGGEVPEGAGIFLPPWEEVLWSAVAFGIVFWMFWKYVLPQMQKALDARTEGIETKLEKAERDRAHAQTLLEQYRTQLAEARDEAARIRTEAHADRLSIIGEARTEAEQAARGVTERAQVQMASEAAQVRAALRGDVGQLAVTLAERIVGEALDPARTAATVDRFIADLEAGAASVDTQAPRPGSR